MKCMEFTSRVRVVEINDAGFVEARTHGPALYFPTLFFTGNRDHRSRNKGCCNLIYKDSIFTPTPPDG